MLGGLAVISHGFSRRTYDADIWLEPKLSHDDWAKAVFVITLRSALRRNPGILADKPVEQTVAAHF